MEYQNLLKPINNSISLYCKSVDEKIFQDFRFIDLMNLILKEENLYQITYALYTDNNLLKTNLYIPTFHTMYLGCGNHNVIIQDSDDIWLCDAFSNNNYYVIADDKKTYDYSQHNIKIIERIQELLNAV